MTPVKDKHKDHISNRIKNPHRLRRPIKSNIYLSRKRKEEIELRLNGGFDWVYAPPFVYLS
jgi:hypothetical protein